ncbi:hypothetical protein [Nocardia colli]|uniref:hypothetical protein n=1 Tax=Nocardia colli TaxID=2545717 RepID=UPI0035DD0CA2
MSDNEPVSTIGDDIFHVTSTATGNARWRIAHRCVLMESVTDYTSQAMAYRVRVDGTTVDIPNGDPGVVYFGEAEQRPELPFVEEYFPHHGDLFAAVEAAYWDVVCPLDHSRLDDLNRNAVVARDYTTGEWRVTEMRADACDMRRSA